MSGNLSLSKISLLVIILVICIYALPLSSWKEGESQTWPFGFMNSKEEEEERLPHNTSKILV
jgi:hypothetical protein